METSGNEFKTLIEFLDRFGPEVVGHSVQEPPPEELRQRLERFVAGQCDHSEIDAMCLLLRTEPQWVDWVAERVREQRRKDGASLAP